MDATIPDESCVETLQAMGFPDVNDIRRALRLSRNDMNEAVALLTNEMPGLDDVEMTDGGASENKSTSEEASTSERDETLEFPTTHLYDLESRVFTQKWNIPYRKDESLGRCLMSAARLAKEGLATSDDSCRRFLERCMPECFEKLLSSATELHRWDVGVHEGISLMLSLLVDLAIAQLAQPIIHHVTMDVLTKAFNSKMEYHQKNRSKCWDRAKWEEDFGGPEKVFAVPAKNTSFAYSQPSYGYLINLINRFASKGGFSLISDKFAIQEGKAKLTPQDMYSLLAPVSVCMEYLNVEAVKSFVAPCLEAAYDMISELSDRELNNTQVLYFVGDLVLACKRICVELHPGSSAKFDRLLLDFVHRLLKSTQFASKMQALREVTKMLQALSSTTDDCAISEDKVSKWLSEKQILSLALEGSIDNPQYCDRLKSLLDFLGPRMSVGDVSKIWQLRRHRAGGVADNVLDIVAQMAVKFQAKELDHLLTLIEKSWMSAIGKEREKLLGLIGQIGRKSTVSITYTKIAELLWSLAHSSGLGNPLINYALQEQLEVITLPGREAERNIYIQKCLEDIKQNRFVLPALSHLHQIIMQCGEKHFTSLVSSKPQKRLLKEIDHDNLVKLMCECLTNIHQKAIQAYKDGGGRLRGGGATAGETGSDSSTVPRRVTVGAVSNLNLVLIPATPVKEPNPLVTPSTSPCSSIMKTPQRSLSSKPFDEHFVLDDGFTLGAYVTAILDFLRFILVEGELFLSSSLVNELFDTLVMDQDACEFERETGFEWMEKGLTDIEAGHRPKLFTERLLKLSPLTMTAKGFSCFKSFFEDVNKQQQKLSSGSLNVEKLDLTGLEFVWSVALQTSDSDLVEQAVGMLIDLYFKKLSPKLKREQEKQHKRFIDECRSRLEAALASLEMTDPVASTTASGSVAAAAAIFNTCNSHDAESSTRYQQVQKVERLLMIAQRYIHAVEETSLQTERVIWPHGATFFGPLLRLRCCIQRTGTTPSEEIKLWVHENELISSLRSRIAAHIDVEPDQTIESFMKQGPVHYQVVLEIQERELGKCWNNRTLRDAEVDIFSAPDISVRLRTSTAFAFVASTDTVMAPQTNEKREKETTSSSGSSGGFSLPSWRSSSKGGLSSEAERQMPACLMANDIDMFSLMHRLVNMGITSIAQAVRDLLLLIPTDNTVGDALEQVSNPNSTVSSSSTKSNSLERLKSKGLARFTPSSPKSKAKAETQQLNNGGISQSRVLDQLLTLTSPTMTPFRLQYHLDVLSGRLLPTLFDQAIFDGADRFRTDFLTAGGLGYLINILAKDFLPPTTPTALQQDIYDRVVVLLSFLLCGKSPLSKLLVKEDIIMPSPVSESGSGLTVATTAKHGGLKPLQSKAIQRLSKDEFVTLMCRLQRLTWAIAGGSLSQLGADLLGSGSRNTSGRSRVSESSTGSSDGETATGSCLHSAVSRSATLIRLPDARTACIALTLMIDAALLRSEGTTVFVDLPHLSHWIIDILLKTPSNRIREKASQELLRLVEESHKTQLSSVEQGMTDDTVNDTSVNDTLKQPSCRFRLLELLVKIPLPLWPASSTAIRGVNHRLLTQCIQYFELRSALLDRLSSKELDQLSPAPLQMLEDEANWLLNYEYTCTTNSSSDADNANVDNVLMAAHLRLIKSLIRLLPIHKKKLGRTLLAPLLTQFLFPAAKLLQECSKDPSRWRDISINDVKPKCGSKEARTAALSLLLEMCLDCPDNLVDLAQVLASLHHVYTPQIAFEWEHLPLVDGRMDANLVGLKNAGATCYMNSILQQIYMQPGLAQTILSLDLQAEALPANNPSDCGLLVELQRIFGHLRESELQYFTPTGFWDRFRLWGQAVNPREQQDAFEFYTDLIDQIDECLRKSQQEPVFKPKYQGVFSDQKICKECPHRYEREEPFYALNVPVRPLSLEESLQQFVKGEILEGDNAYLCEKCNQKRTTLKRLCVKSLPPVLVIQLKRFGYDWEEDKALKFNDYFQFPLNLDMYPYTAAGLQELEDGGESWMDAVTSPLQRKFSSGVDLASSPGSIVSPLQRFLGSDPPRKVMLSDYGPRHSYELVGVVVHSGQASAGHYYSIIRDRRLQTDVDNFRPSRATQKWYKFNDTTVEEIEMTQQYMETELFGGKYTVKNNKKNDGYPEERERYWNAYMLVYQQVGQGYRVATEPRSGSQISNPISTPMSAGASSLSLSYARTPKSQPRRHDSLMELTELVEAGERSQLFQQDSSSDTLPSAIRQEIRENNLRFFRDRDVFSDQYDQFIRNLINRVVLPFCREEKCESGADVARQGTMLLTHYLLNSLWHTKKSLRGNCEDWLRMYQNLLDNSGESLAWLLNFFTDKSVGVKYLPLYLLECGVPEIRQSFAQLLSMIVTAKRAQLDAQLASSASLSLRERQHALANALYQSALHMLMQELLALVTKLAVEKWQNSGAFFELLRSYVVLGGSASCSHFLQCSGFRLVLEFLLEMPSGGANSSSATLGRRWTASQAREFGMVYEILAVLILHCDPRTDPSASPGSPGMSWVVPMQIPVPRLYVEMPPEMGMVVYGNLGPGFMKELVWAASYVHSTAPILGDVIVHCSNRNWAFSERFAKEALSAAATQPSNELRFLFSLLERFVLLSDSYAERRIECLLDGQSDVNCVRSVSRDAEQNDQPILGLLKIIESSHERDSRRSYNCIKFLVHLSKIHSLMKEPLNRRAELWQWAVQWLRERMDLGTEDNGEKNGSGWSSGKDVATDVSGQVSNEDSCTRAFQRTVSAQYTLEEASALLSEFDAAGMEPTDQPSPELPTESAATQPQHHRGGFAAHDHVIIEVDHQGGDGMQEEDEGGSRPRAAQEETDCPMFSLDAAD